MSKNNTLRAYFRESLALVSSIPLILMGAFFLECVTIFLGRTLSVWALIVVIPVKMCWFGGILGGLVDVIRGKALTMSWSRFKQNIKIYWGLGALFFIVPAVLSFVINYANALQGRYVYVDAYAFDLVVMSLVSYLMVNHKSASNVRQRGWSTLVTLKVSVLVFVCLVMDLGLIYFPYVTNLGELFDIQVLMMGGSLYLRYFVFIFLGVVMVGHEKAGRESSEHAQTLILVNPIGGEFFSGIASLFMRMYPPFFLVLKCFTPKSYRIHEVNSSFWYDRFYQANALVAITCFTSNCVEAYKIAKNYKARGAQVIMGGPHVTYLPEEALLFCDSVVIGEGESIWSEVIQDYEAGTLKKIYQKRPTVEDREHLQQEMLKAPVAELRHFIEPTRGCKFKCEYCMIPSLSDGQIWRKSIADVMALVKKVRQEHYDIDFLDNNIYNDPAYTKELFKALIPLKVRWKCFATIDMAKNESVLQLAKQSGCSMLIFGYEIFGGSPEAQDQGGKLAMADRYIDYTRRVQRAGIAVRGNFMYGFDSDNWESLFKLWAFAMRVKPFIAVVSLVTPFPGTEFYRQMVAAKRIRNMNWMRYSAMHYVLHHPNPFVERFSKVFFPFFTTLFSLTTSTIGKMALCLLLLAIGLYQII